MQSLRGRVGSVNVRLATSVSQRILTTWSIAIIRTDGAVGARRRRLGASGN